MKKILAILAIGAVTNGSAVADIIYGTGENVDMAPHVIQGGAWGSSWSGVVTDPNWQIVAVPSSDSTETSGVPYNPFVPQAVPGVYVGGNDIGGQSFSPTDPNFGAYQAGITMGDNSYRWMAPLPNTSSLQSGLYTWIAAQQFTVSATGLYNINFQGAGDDGMTFYVGGTVDTSAPNMPTITGGRQIGPTDAGFNSLTTFMGDAYLTAGTNTAYIEVEDTGGQTAAFVGQVSIEAVPEPGSIALLGVGAAGLAFLRRKSGKK